MSESPWLTREEVAERLRVPKATLAMWATNRSGPPFAKFGRHCRYHIDQVKQWENEQFGEAS